MSFLAGQRSQTSSPNVSMCASESRAKIGGAYFACIGAQSESLSVRANSARSHERKDDETRVASPSCRISRLDVATGGEFVNRATCVPCCHSLLCDHRPGPVFRRRGLFIDLLFCLLPRASECFGFGTVPVPRSDCTF